jgi:glyoxylase-like metal-dependent hydrolase (beta-lactamase superfamily II)
MKIIPLSEGSFTIDQSKKFVPFDTADDDLKDRAKGSLLVEIQPFVVVTSRDVLLLDTGLGYTERDGSLQIHHNLMNAGINPLDITKVLLTHLHKDHAGGIGIEQPMLKQHYLSFPNAQYYGSGMIDAYIEYAPSGGHSPYHQVFWIRENGETIFFGGDEAPQLHQMKNRFIAKYDFDGRKAMELRQQWWEQGQKEGWVFLFYHDVKSPFLQATSS